MITMLMIIEDPSKVGDIKEFIMVNDYILNWSEQKDNEYWMEIIGEPKDVNILYDKIVVINRSYNSFIYRVWIEFKENFNILRWF